MNLHALDLFAAAVLVYLVVVIPLVGIWDARRLKAWTAAGRPDARLATYRWILVLEWVSALGLLGAWMALGRPAAPLRLGLGFAGWQWLPVGVTAALVVVQLWQSRVAIADPRGLAKVRRSMGDLIALAPRDARELRVFGSLAITAGVCEEIMYRGVLLAVTAPVVGPWPALAVTSAIFGLGHAYQGAGGVLKTGLVGVLFGLVTLLSGSLVPAMVLHAVIDISAGQMMHAALHAPAAVDDEPAGAPSAG